MYEISHNLTYEELKPSFITSSPPSRLGHNLTYEELKQINDFLI